MSRVNFSIVFIVFFVSFLVCKYSYGSRYVLTKTLVLNESSSGMHDATADSVLFDVSLVQRIDSMYIYDCIILNNSAQEQWVILFENPVFEVEVILKNEFQERSYSGGLIKKGSFLNFKKKYAVNIPIVIPTNIPTEILLKVKSHSREMYSLHPALVSMDEFMHDLKVSSLFDNLLLGVLIFLVFLSLYFFMRLKKKVFLFVALSLFFIVLQCSNVNLFFSSFENINIIFVFLSASSFYFVFITQIVLYRIIVTPFYRFVPLEHLLSVLIVVLYFSLGIQVAFTLINPELVLRYMVYFYLPFLLIAFVIGVFIIVKTEFLFVGLAALLVVFGFFASIFELFGGFCRFVPLEFGACCAGVIILVDQFKSTNSEPEMAMNPSLTMDHSKSKTIDAQSNGEMFMPPNLLENIGHEVILLRWQDVAFLKIENKACCIHTFKKGVIISTRSLEYYEKHFHNVFFRLNRQFLISPEGIQKITVSKDYQYNVLLNCCNSTEEILLTKNKTHLFKNWLSYSNPDY